MSFVILDPYYVEKIWGGSLIRKIKSLDVSGPILGESWEVSKLEGCSSSVDGKLLENLVTDEQLPYLIKFIDTSDNLSVQVHPDDTYALKNENSTGKSECWVILEARDEAGIYLGFKENTDSEKFKTAVNQQKDLTKYLNFHSVKRGDFFYVPAGTVHAIGKDVLLCEVQQSSGITYRVWDWNRVDSKGIGRELHIDKAMDVLNFSNSFNLNETFKIKNNCLNSSTPLINHPSFNLSTHVLSPGESFDIPVGEIRKRTIVCLEGELNIAQSNKSLLAYNTGILLTDEKACITTDVESKFLFVR